MKESHLYEKAIVKMSSVLMLACRIESGLVAAQSWLSDRIRARLNLNHLLRAQAPQHDMFHASPSLSSLPAHLE